MTTSKTKMDVQAINEAVEKFNEDFKAVLLTQHDNVKRAVADRDAEAYRFAAGLLDLALLLKPWEISDTFVDFLQQRGQRVAKGGDNPYTPFVKAVVAVKVGAKWKVNPKEPSFGKYANIVRQLVECHEDGDISGTTEAFIQAYTWGDFRKLGALEKRDRHMRPNQSAVERTEKLRDKGRNARVIETIKTSIGANDGDVVIMWGVINNGQLEVMKRSISNDAAPSLFKQLGVEMNRS